MICFFVSNTENVLELSSPISLQTRSMKSEDFFNNLPQVDQFVRKSFVYNAWKKSFTKTPLKPLASTLIRHGHGNPIDIVRAPNKIYDSLKERMKTIHEFK